RLARPRQPGEDDQAVAGQLEVDVAQVVLACTPDDQRLSHGARGYRVAGGQERMFAWVDGCGLGSDTGLAQLAAQLVDLVAQPGRVLEAQLGRRLVHLLLEGLDEA